jgi:hypothetical protein
MSYSGKIISKIAEFCLTCKNFKKILLNSIRFTNISKSRNLDVHVGIRMTVTGDNWTNLCQNKQNLELIFTIQKEKND